MSDTSTIADDQLEGAQAIAEFLWGPGAPAKRVYAACRVNSHPRFPIYRIGTRIFARKSTLQRWIKAQEDGARAI